MQKEVERKTDAVQGAIRYKQIIIMFARHSFGYNVLLIWAKSTVLCAVSVWVLSRERDSKLEGIDLSQFEYPGSRGDQSARRLINPRYIKSHHAHRRRDATRTHAPIVSFPVLWNGNWNRRNRNFFSCGTGTGIVTCQKVGTGTVINYGSSSHKLTV